MTPIVPPEGRQVFSYQITPEPADFDANGHVNNVVYLRWAQEAGIAHWTARMPPEDLARWAWVALRHEIDYRRALMPGETATLRTWVGERNGPRLPRYVRIDGPDGEVCAQSVTQWCLIDAATKRPHRTPDAIVQRFA